MYKYITSRFRPYKDTIILDLDNTLFAAMKALENELDWYTTEGQTHYLYHECWTKPQADRALDLYHRSDVLRKMEFIPEVVDYLKQEIKNNDNIQILIVTKTKEINAWDRFYQASQLPKIGQHIVGILAWQEEYPIEELQNLKGRYILALDDNPYNWDLLIENQIHVMPILYRYNLERYRNGMDTDFVKGYIVPEVAKLESEKFVIYLT